MIEEPRGQPVFKFFLAKSGPVMMFLDDGCSDCVMREGVPGVQWEGGGCDQEGPIRHGWCGGPGCLDQR